MKTDFDIAIMNYELRCKDTNYAATDVDALDQAFELSLNSNDKL